jgi:nitrite reductase/ring-hydroxylating ferredoxin subunit
MIKRGTQIRILKELMDHLDKHRTCDAGKVAMSPTIACTDPLLAQRGWEAFFANHPQILGLSGELPQAGSYMTSSDLGVPTLATRDSNGEFHAFVNACRQRGAELTSASRAEASRFICPFHSWICAADGRLVGIREAGQFGAIDKACHSLVELMGEKTQAAANSAKIDYFLFGRNEPAPHHFHNNYRSALGMPPLEEYRPR